MDYFWLILGFITLILGGDFLVRGAVGLALKAQISTLVIGMTVVSFGTSAPELLVSIGAAMEGGEDSLMSAGNVIGSNIANLALVLGVTALIYPIKVNRTSIRQDWPVMMMSTVLFVVFMRFFDGENYQINNWEGAVLFTLIICFTWFLIWKSKKSKKAMSSGIDPNDDGLDLEGDDEITAESGTPLWKNIAFLVGGCVGLVLGSNWLLGAATNIATAAGISPFIIGVTILAFGTSVPELAASAIAAYRKQTDIAIGNLIGSNVFNILCVVGLTGLVAKMPLQANVLNYDAWWMLAIAFVLLPLMLMGGKIHRWKGVVLLLSYAVYIYFLLA